MTHIIPSVAGNRFIAECDRLNMMNEHAQGQQKPCKLVALHGPTKNVYLSIFAPALQP